MNVKFINSMYTNYIHFILYDLYNLLKKIIYFKVGEKLSILNNLKIYFNLINLKSQYILPYYNYYSSANRTIYYSINIPLKFCFNNLKEFTINYNILNIPKLNQVGVIILNGFSRIPIFYLTYKMKFVEFDFMGYKSHSLYVKLINSDILKVNLIKDDEDAYALTMTLEDIELVFDVFLLNLTDKVNFNFSPSKLINILYIFRLLSSKRVNKFYIFNKNLSYLNLFLSEFIYIEIFTLVWNFLNDGFKKKFFTIDDNLVNKECSSVLDKFFGLIKQPFYILQFIRLFNLFKKNFILKLTKKRKSISRVIFKEEFIVNSTLHYANNFNILSYISSKAKINLFGYSSASKNRFIVKKDTRHIQYDHLGIVNMLYTTDGSSCGLLTTLVDRLRIVNNKFEAFLNQKKDSSNYIFIDILSKNLVNIIFNNFTITKKNCNFKVKTVEVLQNNEFKVIKLSPNSVYEYNFEDTNMFSITELVIPFLLNNDPCRGLMGSKMHTQASPLIYSNLPYVSTKYNNINNSVIYKCIYSICDGIVSEVTNYSISIIDDKNRCLSYYLCPYNIHDYNNYNVYKPIVWPGEFVNFGQILAVPNDFINLEFTLGVNSLINYNFYYGYEHEDAIILNKECLFSNILTSINFKIYEEHLLFDRLRYIELTLPNLLKYNRYRRFIDNSIGILDLKSYLFENDIIIAKIRCKLFKLKYKFRKKQLKLIFKKNKKVIISKKFLKVGKKHTGRLVKYNITSYNRYKQPFKNINSNFCSAYVYMRFYICSLEKIKTGDKLCGRHGNKGIISKIVDVIDIPYTCNDSYAFITTSPVGALSRMNLGQFLEGLCGNVSYNYNNRIKAPVNLYNNYLYSNLCMKSLSNMFNKYEVFNMNFLNKTYLRDFRTGYKLKNYSLMLLAYYFKLSHTAKAKFNYRNTGKYNLITQQPIASLNSKKGQRFGEMEVWALEAYGASYNLKELLLKTNYKLLNFYDTTYKCSETFRSLTVELKNILINIKINKYYKLQDNNLVVNY